MAYLVGLKTLVFLPDNSLVIQFLPEFRAKNQKPDDALLSLVVRPLTDIVDYQDDLLICPVPSLRRYI